MTKRTAVAAVSVMAGLLVWAGSGSAAGDPIEGTFAQTFDNEFWPKVEIKQSGDGWVGKVAQRGSNRDCIGWSLATQVGREIWRLQKAANGMYTGTAVVDQECDVEGNEFPDDQSPPKQGLSQVDGQWELDADGEHFLFTSKWTVQRPDDFANPGPAEETDTANFYRVSNAPAGSKPNPIKRGSSKVKPRKGGRKKTFKVKFPTEKDNLFTDYSYYVDAVIKTKKRNCNSRFTTTSRRKDGGGKRKKIKLKAKRGNALPKNATESEKKRKWPGGLDYALDFGKRKKRWCKGKIRGTVWEVARPQGGGNASIEAVDNFKAKVKGGGKKKRKGGKKGKRKR